MPKLFLIRHAIAEEREVFKKTGLPDEKRPLTQEGRKKMQKVAAKLFSIEPDVEEFYQSPLTRSQQTVQVLQKFYSQSKVATLATLAPNQEFSALLKDLQKLSKANKALIGHEDHLSQFLAYLLTGKNEAHPFAFKKGGIACLEYQTVEAGAYELKWLVTPKLFLS